MGRSGAPELEQYYRPIYQWTPCADKDCDKDPKIEALEGGILHRMPSSRYCERSTSGICGVLCNEYVTEILRRVLLPSRFEDLG